MIWKDISELHAKTAVRRKSNEESELGADLNLLAQPAVPFGASVETPFVPGLSENFWITPVSAVVYKGQLARVSALPRERDINRRGIWIASDLDNLTRAREEAIRF